MPNVGRICWKRALIVGRNGSPGMIRTYDQPVNSRWGNGSTPRFIPTIYQILSNGFLRVTAGVLELICYPQQPANLSPYVAGMSSFVTSRKRQVARKLRELLSPQRILSPIPLHHHAPVMLGFMLASGLGSSGMWRKYHVMRGARVGTVTNRGNI